MAADTTIPFSTTLNVRDTCLCMHVQRAARALARRYDEALKPFSITNGQFSLLMSLNRPEPARMGAVAELLSMDRTTLTAALKSLERRGFIVVAADPADRRSRRLTLTPAGMAVLVDALPAWTRTQGEVASALAARGPDALRKDLVALA